MKGSDGGDVDQITRGMARLDLDPQYYLNLTLTGVAKLPVIMDFVTVSVTAQEIQLGQRATLKLAGTAKLTLSSVSPAMWISANARIMAPLVDKGDQHIGNIKDYMAYNQLLVGQKNNNKSSL